MRTDQPTPTLIVAARFAGPPGSGNGGYTAGRLAAHAAPAGATSGVQVRSPIRVTLRRPPPLDQPMEVRRSGSHTLLLDGETLVAEAEPGLLAADPPPAVDVQAAERAYAAYAGQAAHPFPRCFVCGPGRSPGDGLLLSPGLLRPGQTACVWRPTADLAASETGLPGDLVATEFVWAALDCPGGWTSNLQARPLVLGQMAAVCSIAPRVGDELVVVGRLLSSEGRKTRTVTGLFDAGGQLLAQAEHVWIAVDPATFNATAG